MTKTKTKNSVKEIPGAIEAPLVISAEAAAINERLTPPDADWLERLRWNGFTADASHSPNLDPLKLKLLAVAGFAVTLPPIEEDLHKILTRGQVFDGAKSILKRGVPSQCHANVCDLYRQSDTMQICTGYALSAQGGIWRQHSWGLMPDGTVIETTERRILYFGFVMTANEALQFDYDNS